MRVFALYLPQFYPTPENDEQWGKGFTEWTRVANAQPLYPGHFQPNLPTDLGFYDLRLAENIATQIEYADEVGVDGFAFWHYWFGKGEMTLERPSQELLKNTQLRKNFYFTWVNCSWTKQWVGDDTVLFDQVYDEDDYRRHFDYLVPFFSDDRYEKVDGKPVFAVNHIYDLPNTNFFDVFNEEASKNGFPGIFWLGGMDGRLDAGSLKYIDFLYGYPPGDVIPHLQELKKDTGWLRRRKSDTVPRRYSYSDFVKEQKSVFEKCSGFHSFMPVHMPNWDNTPRYETRGFLFEGQTRENLIEAMQNTLLVGGANRCPFVLCKAWNEWAEGNMIEPCKEHGTLVGDSLKEAISLFYDGAD